MNRTLVGPDGISRPPATLEQLQLLPGVREACIALHELGFELIVVTNQPDVVRGTQRRELVEEMNRRLARELGLDDVRTCFHDDADACECRKPAPGLIVGAARERDIDLGSSFLVGDRCKDIEAGRRAGCRTVLIDRGVNAAVHCQPDFRAASLLAAVEWIEKGLA